MEDTMTTQWPNRRHYGRRVSMRIVLSVLLLLSVHLVVPSCAQRMITSLGMKLKKDPKQPPTASTTTNRYAIGELWKEQPDVYYYSVAAAILLAAIGSKLLLAGESQDSIVSRTGCVVQSMCLTL